MSLTFTDIFCGAGGSSIGLTAAGFQLKLAANHWDRAIETHAANFRDAEHLCADVSNYDMRRLPTTDVLWASPICTEISPAGGRKRTRGQLDLLQSANEEGTASSDGLDRTRATFHDVIRATEVHRYKAVLVENVTNVASDWELFDWWVSGMVQLGYNVQFVSVSSAHIGDETNPHAPQWRDRLYMVFTRKGIALPDVAPRPLAHCAVCDQTAPAVQSWKRPDRRRIGKYGQQYVYRCPNTTCRHAIVEPYVLPAAAAIDWTDQGTLIGERARPLAEKTMRRIRTGLAMFAQPVVAAAGGNTWERPGSDYVRAWPALELPVMARTGTPGDGVAVPPFLSPAGGTWNDTPSSVDTPMRTRTTRDTEALICPPVMVSVNHDDARAYLVDERPLPSRTTKIGDGIAVAPFVAELRGGGSTARPTQHPLSTVTAGGRHHGLVVPDGAFYVKNYGGHDPSKVKPVGTPLGAITATGGNHALVIPYRRGAKPHRADREPVSTVATREQHGLMHPAVDIDAVRFRMLKPREHLAAQRFPRAYTVLGNGGEQTMQAGNAVSSNVAQWLATALAAVL
ncbi:DNA cytosine methyltransferase [Umezawaea beigongshangensis]|uniref:DNA cytosine methyltransferase n=1 Tax=Umezawaea beigongshangensis TaxID=2780383 RepID=UPI0018F17A43|nr:DNA cytosine methyltransferase [Umezawaea beigongshangensis]